MANQESDTSLVPSSDGITLRVKDFSAGGGASEYAITVPQNDARWQDIVLRAAFLKKGTMVEQSFGAIVCAIMYADSMGLNVMAGDVYIVNGKLATSADAKIRHALGSGRIEGYEVEMTPGPAIDIQYSIKGKLEIWTGPNVHAKITVHVKGWKKPVVYESDLEEWFNGANAAWREHTSFMFRKNALSKALGEVAPLGVDADEVPAAPVLSDAKEFVKSLTKPKEEEVNA
jgi:hypothetical protein